MRSHLGEERVEPQDKLPVSLKQLPDPGNDPGGVDPTRQKPDLSVATPTHKNPNRHQQRSLLSFELLHDLKERVINELVAAEPVLHIAKVCQRCTDVASVMAYA